LQPAWLILFVRDTDLFQDAREALDAIAKRIIRRNEWLALRVVGPRRPYHFHKGYGFADQSSKRQ